MRQTSVDAANVRLTRSRWTPTPPYTHLWSAEGARKSYKPEKQGERELPAHSEPLWRRPGSTSEASWRSGDRPEAGSRLRVIWKASSPLCRGTVTDHLRPADAGLYCGEAVGSLETTAADSAWWRAKPHVWWEHCGRRSGSGFPAYRSQRAMRVPLSTGRLGPGLPIYCLALREAGRPPRRSKPRPRPNHINCSTRRSTRIEFCDQHGGVRRSAGVALQSACGGGESD